MKKENGILCVTYKELTSGDDPVILANTLKSCVTRNRIRRVQRGGGEDSVAVYDYGSLPEKYKRRFVAKYGAPEEAMEDRQADGRIKTDTMAREFYNTYKVSLGGRETTMPEDMIEEYTINASVLNYLMARFNELIAVSNLSNNKRPRREIWAVVANECEELRERYGHTLPRNLSRLKDKIKCYKKDGYAALISGKVGNSNTSKIVPEIGERLIALKRSKRPCYDNAGIFTEINRAIAEHNRGLLGNGVDRKHFWKPIRSVQSLANWFKRPDIEPLWKDAVIGEQAARIRYSRQHRTELPVRRDALWYGDGTKLNLYYRDEDGQVRTTGVYEVIDAYSEVFLGYFISDTEDYWAQYQAFRMAIQVSRHKPYEIVYDNQGGHKKLESQRFFEKLCTLNRPTAPYNGRSKTIESAFGRFQKQVLGRHWNFTGMNITTKREESHPDVEFIQANKDNLPTLTELRNIYSEARRQWNSMPHPATGIPRMEMYENSTNPDTQEVTEWDMVEMFWLETGKMATFTPDGITIQVKGQKYTYEVLDDDGNPDMEWRSKHTYEQFKVKYDPFDMTKVLLYWKDRAGKFRLERMAETYICIHRATQEQEEGERAFIRQMQEANEQARVKRMSEAKAIEARYGTLPEQNGLRTPDPKGLSKRGKALWDEKAARYGTEEECELGKREKAISNMTYYTSGGNLEAVPVNHHSKDGEEVTEQSMAEKL